MRSFTKAAICLSFASAMLLNAAPSYASLYLDASSFNVGQAGGYAMLGLLASVNDGTDEGTQNSSQIIGNVGIGPNGTLAMSNSSKITGTLMKHSTTTVTLTGTSSITGGQVVNDAAIAAAIADAYAASADFAAATAGQTYGNVSVTGSNNQTISGGAGTNVIETGNISLSGSSSLTLSGSADTYFLINVHGDFSMAGSSQIILTGGVTADQVLFNILAPSGTGLTLGSSGNSFGTFLLASSGASLSSSGTLYGALIGDGQSITLANSRTINGVPIAAVTHTDGVVPEPGTIAIWSVLALSAVVGARKWRQLA